VPADDAAWTARLLVRANLRGHDSHGVIRIPQYVGSIRKGETNPRPAMQILAETPTTAILDGDLGLGQVVARRAAEVALDKAARQGLAAVGTRRSNHIGRLADYAELAAERMQLEAAGDKAVLNDLDSALVRMYRRTRAEGFGPEVKRRIMLGTYALSAGYYDAYYLKALKVRRLIRQDFDNAFGKVDLIAGPITPAPAFKIGEMSDDPLAMYLTDAMTIPANLAGVPAISVPCPVGEGELPVGLHLQAPFLQEERLLRVAAAFESAAGEARLHGAALLHC